MQHAALCFWDLMDLFLTVIQGFRRPVVGSNTGGMFFCTSVMNALNAPPPS